MKYCHNCGKEVLDEAVICVGCGVSLNRLINSQDDKKSSGYAVLSFFIPTVGLILWLVWSNQLPLRASSCKKGFFIGIAAYIIFAILYVILLFYLIGNGYVEYEYSQSYYNF